MKKKVRFITLGILLLLILMITIYFGANLLESLDPLNRNDNFSKQREWLDGREKIYRKAAAEANQGLTGIAAAHQLDWELLAAIDFMLITTEKFSRESFAEEFEVFESAVYPHFNISELAYALRPVIWEEKSYMEVKTVYTLKEEYREKSGKASDEEGENVGNDEYAGNVGDDGYTGNIGDARDNAIKNPDDLIDRRYYDAQTTEENVKQPLKTDTYMGIFTYLYEEEEDIYVSRYDEEGKILELVHVRGPVLIDSNYQEDWSRLKRAIVEHAGLKEKLIEAGVKAEDFVTPEDVRKILEIAEELTYGFDLYEKIGYYGHAWPVLEGGRKVTSVFGWRSNPFGGRREFHTGMDIAPMVRGRPGDLLVAAASGKISAQGGYGSARGYYLEIEDSDGLLYRYFHLDGKKPFHQRALTGEVKVGEVIGFMGTTGSSTAIHLHFDVSYQGEVPDILKNVEWVDDDGHKDFNRKYIYKRYYICPCILLKQVAPDIENSCKAP